MEDHFLFYCVSIWWREDWIPSSASWDQVTRPGSVAAFYFLATAASWLNAGIDGRTAGKQELALLWHVCPKFTCWNSNAGCDGIRRQGFWEVLRSQGCSPHELVFYKRHLTQLPNLWYHGRKQQKDAVSDSGRELSPDQHLDLQLPELWHKLISYPVSGILLKLSEWTKTWMLSWCNENTELLVPFLFIVQRAWVRRQRREKQYWRQEKHREKQNPNVLLNTSLDSALPEAAGQLVF